MIVVRAPLRISFVGGGTDLESFYKKNSGSVISATIDKYVYVILHKTVDSKNSIAKYSITEVVDNIKNIKNDHIRNALLDFGIRGGIEIGSFANIPSVQGGLGLGSSSAFSVALMKGLHALHGKKLNKEESAKEATRLEIDLCKSPIGKQDQYASAYGGFNIFNFNKNGKVHVDPVFLSYESKVNLERSILIFSTGITRSASNSLKNSQEDRKKGHHILKKMAQEVPIFRDKLVNNDLAGMGKILKNYWDKKKKTHQISPELEALNKSALRVGAFGGKVLGAGGGGCLMFIADPAKHGAIKKSLKNKAKNLKLSDFKEIPTKFVQSGVEVLFNSDEVL